MVLQRWVFFDPIATLICSARFDAPQLFVAHQPRLQEPLQRFDIVLHFNALSSNCLLKCLMYFLSFAKEDNRVMRSSMLGLKEKRNSIKEVRAHIHLCSLELQLDI